MKDSKKPSDDSDFKAKFCFTPTGKCPDGYIPDTGATFGEKGEHVYGWGRDITSNAR
jgi:hypothetical protein